jgi:hypothetical protein
MAPAPISAALAAGSRVDEESAVVAFPKAAVTGDALLFLQAAATGDALL